MPWRPIASGRRQLDLADFLLQALPGFFRQLVKELHAVVWPHGIEDGLHVERSAGKEQDILQVIRELGEHIGSDIHGQDAEEPLLLLISQGSYEIGCFESRHSGQRNGGVLPVLTRYQIVEVCRSHFVLAQPTLLCDLELVTDWVTG